MKLSIIVPVYNMAADGKLEYCLNSLVNQQINDYEIIAVDDASTDNSYEVIKEYEKRYPEKVVALRLEENHKQGGAKNKGLEIAKGDYIGFVDSDDWITPDMYKKLIGRSEKTGADIVVCDITRTDSHSMEVRKADPGISDEITGKMTDAKFAKVINDTAFLVVGVYKRHLFFEPDLRFPEHMFYEDNAIATELYHRASHIEHVKEVMYFYYQHSGSTVHGVTEERCHMRMEAMRIMVNLAKENGYFDRYKDELGYKYYCLFYRNTLFSYMYGSQRKKLSFVREIGKELLDTFPDFMNNPLYIENISKEDKRFTMVHMKSSLLFMLYHKAIWTYRKIRYGKSPVQ